MFKIKHSCSSRWQICCVNNKSYFVACNDEFMETYDYSSTEATKGAAHCTQVVTDPYFYWITRKLKCAAHDNVLSLIISAHDKSRGALRSTRPTSPKWESLLYRGPAASGKGGRWHRCGEQVSEATTAMFMFLVEVMLPVMMTKMTLMIQVPGSRPEDDSSWVAQGVRAQQHQPGGQQWFQPQRQGFVCLFDPDILESEIWQDCCEDDNVVSQGMDTTSSLDHLEGREQGSSSTRHFSWDIAPNFFLSFFPDRIEAFCARPLTDAAKYQEREKRQRALASSSAVYDSFFSGLVKIISWLIDW